MDNYQWFKFNPTNWMLGKVQRCSDIDQARFIRLCCLYWTKSGMLSIEDAQIELDDSYEKLLKRKIFSEFEEYVRIEFIDEQLNEIESKKELSSTKGFIGNLKRWHPKIYKEYKDGKISLDKAKEYTNSSPPDPNPIAIQSLTIAEEKREEDIRLDKKKKEEITIKAGLILPYETENFKNAWIGWLQYKKEQFDFKFEGVNSEQIALKQLSQMCDTEKEAIKIIENSIANGWKGFYKPEKGKDEKREQLKNYHRAAEAIKSSQRG